MFLGSMPFRFTGSFRDNLRIVVDRYENSTTKDYIDTQIMGIPIIGNSSAFTLIKLTRSEFSGRILQTAMILGITFVAVGTLITLKLKTGYRLPDMTTGSKKADNVIEIDSTPGKQG